MSITGKFFKIVKLNPALETVRESGAAGPSVVNLVAEVSRHKPTRSLIIQQLAEMVVQRFTICRDNDSVTLTIVHRIVKDIGVLGQNAVHPVELDHLNRTTSSLHQSSAQDRTVSSEQNGRLRRQKFVIQVRSVLKTAKVNGVIGLSVHAKKDKNHPKSKLIYGPRRKKAVEKTARLILEPREQDSAGKTTVIKIAKVAGVHGASAAKNAIQVVSLQPTKLP